MKYSKLISIALVFFSCSGNDSKTESVNYSNNEYKIPVAPDSVLSQVNSRYQITLNKDFKSASVIAELKDVDSIIQMNPYGAQYHKPYRWASFVKNLKLTDSLNNSISYKLQEGGIWTLPTSFKGELKVSYDLAFDFKTESWPAGNEHGFYWEDSTMYSLSKALYIYSENTKAVEVIFSLPGNASVHTVYPSHPNSETNNFIAPNIRSLLSGVVVMGKPEVLLYSDADYAYILSLIGKVGKDKDLIFDAITKIHKRINQWFPSPSLSFHQVMFYGGYEDGEFLGNSSALSTDVIPDKTNSIMWANTIAHELLHLWHAGPRPYSLSGTSFGTSQWTSEGFTEYLANRALIEEDIVSKEDYIDMLKKHIGAYLYYINSPAFDASLLESGKRKSYNRPGVYSGGYTVAFCLDVIIQKNSNGQKDFGDFIRSFYNEFKGKRYSYEDVVQHSSQIASEDLTDFFERYVKGTEAIPVKEYLQEAGFIVASEDYAGFLYLWEKPDKSDSQLQIFNNLTNSK